MNIELHAKTSTGMENNSKAAHEKPNIPWLTNNVAGRAPAFNMKTSLAGDL